LISVAVGLSVYAGTCSSQYVDVGGQRQAHDAGILISWCYTCGSPV